MNGQRTYAFAEDVGTLTVPGEKNVNANCNKYAATLADGSPGMRRTHATRVPSVRGSPGLT